MAKTDSWMPLHLQPWRTGTAFFSAAERGAYLELLLAYWELGPLPNDDAILEQLSKCRGKEWKWVRAKVLAKFSLRDGAWCHERADTERAKAKQIYDNKAAAGKAGGKASGKARTKHSGSKNEADVQPDAEANGQPETNTTYLEPSPSGENPPKSPQGGAVDPEGFERFWEAYPHKVGLKAAISQWAAALETADAETIIAGAATYAKTKAEGVAFLNPASWLRRERWTDEPAMASSDSPVIAASAQELADAQWKNRLDGWNRGFRKAWDRDQWGPPPDEAGCRVPKHLLPPASSSPQGDPQDDVGPIPSFMRRSA